MADPQVVAECRECGAGVDRLAVDVEACPSCGSDEIVETERNAKPAVGSTVECGHFRYTVVSHECATGMGADCPNGDDAITVLAARFARYPQFTQCVAANKMKVVS